MPFPTNRPPTEYDRESFEHRDIVLTLSTARTQNPWVTVSVGRQTREPGRPSPWIPWDRLDDVIEALKALRASPQGIEAEAITAQNRERHAERERRRDAVRTAWTGPR